MRPFDWNGAGGNVLVVDDSEPNRLLLRDLLEARGCRVTEAVDAESAMASAARELPDVILLDVNMPGTDGIEVCRRLKASPRTEAIPVILVTALAHREDRLRGMESGANDYITKPFDSPELGLRVRNALSLRRAHARAEQQLVRLRELETLRDGLVHMLVHDLRTPLTGIRLYLEMLKTDAEALGAGQAGAPEFVELVDEANAITARMTDMVNDLLDASRFEAGAMPLEHASVALGSLVAEAIGLVGARGRKRQVDIDGSAGDLVCDANVIRRVIANLVGNAVDFSPEEKAVRVHIERRNGNVRVTVSDDGPGIPPEYHERIFEKFGQLEATRNHIKHSSGLGLTFCKLAVQAHGGRIGVDSEPGQGSTFWFELPAAGMPLPGTDV